jgi:Family of unknown function (DUF6011)
MSVVQFEPRKEQPFADWKDTRSQAEKDREEQEFVESASRYMVECQERWAKKGKAVISWIDEKPVWVGAADFDVILQNWGEAKAPFKRVFRFSLIGGGQIKTVEHFDWWPSREPRKDQSIGHDKTDLVVTVHGSDGVHRFHTGSLKSACSEMSADAVLFGRGTPQEVADRTAATLRALDTNLENFCALLDSASGCALCGRPLRDEISKLVGVGPDCAHKNGIPHSIAAASKRLELRRKLLGGNNPETETPQ